MTPGFPEDLFRLIAGAIDAELHLETELSGPALPDDPFADGRYDLGWVCSTSFVDLALSADPPSVELVGVAWVPDDPDVGGRPEYFGDVVVPEGSPIAGVGDLAGLRVGCNDIVSLSGHHALRLAVQELGEDPGSFADLVFTGGHHASLDAVIAGELDAAVVDSVVRMGRSRHDNAVADLKVVERLGPWPVQPLVARRGLPSAVIDRVRSTLLAANDDESIRRALHAAALERIVTIDESHYRGVHDALA